MAPARHRELERHLKDCKNCGEFLQTLKATITACRYYGAVYPAEISPSLKSALRRKLAKALTESGR